MAERKSTQPSVAGPSEPSPWPAAIDASALKGGSLWTRLSGSKASITFSKVIKRIWNETQEDNCIGLAAQISYYFVLSFFPFLIFLAALVGHLPFTDLWTKILAWIAQSFPFEAQRLILDTVAGLTSQRTKFLSLGLLGTAWAATSGIVSLIEGLNVAYEVKESRSFWKIRLLALVMLFVLSFFFITSFSLLSTGDWLERWVTAQIGERPLIHALWKIGRWTLSLVLLGMGVAIVYYALPNNRRPGRWITPGSAFVVLAWIPAPLIFGFYLKNFASYEKIYGSLGAFVILMVWIYITSLIILIGAEINSELDKAVAKAPGSVQ